MGEKYVCQALRYVFKVKKKKKKFASLYYVTRDYTRDVRYQLVKLNVLMATARVNIHARKNGRACNHYVQIGGIQFKLHRIVRFNT